MKLRFKYTLLIISVTASCLLFSCKKFLVEDVYTQYDPQSFLQTEDGIQKVLIGAYSELQVIDYGARDDMYTLSEFSTDEMLESGGGFEKQAVPFINFQWDPTISFFNNIWAEMYRAIRDANVLLDNIGNIKSISADKIAAYTAEARFIRAAAYIHLYRYFGPVPLITSSASLDLTPSRPDSADFIDFVTTELKSAVQDLPLTQPLRGEATKGAALAVLCKLYLNLHQWQSSADAAKQIMDLNIYRLFPDITTLFSVRNENNDEFIYVFPCVAQAGHANVYMPHAFPPDYPIQANWINFGAQFRLYSSFVKSFDPGDKRLEMILTHYTDTKGQYHELVENAQGQSLDNARSFKFIPDPDAQSQANGNDIPVIRYADILLSRAEALNESQGPNQESIDLINMVRERAGVFSLKLSDFATKDALRNWILKERGWEFYSEGKRRGDMIRMNKYISSAVERGKSAKPYQVLYPIPQREIDANPNLTQNDGY